MNQTEISSSLNSLLTTTKTRIKKFFEQLLPINNLETIENDLNAAMRYAMFSNGKCLRSALVYATGSLLGIPEAKLDAAAASLELIHCYSLIHDDLPAMDDDDLRRGKPTCHRKFNEATAILAGDALQTLAFEALSNPTLNLVSADAKVEMIHILARAAGSNGMILGQAEDLSAENKLLTLFELTNLHKRKTGALLTAAVQLPLAINKSQVKVDTIKHLCNYAHNLGLAYQIRDDILDVTENSATLGKPAGSDQKHNKSTFPAILGLDQAQEQANLAYEQAITALNDFDQTADVLRDLAYFCVNRKY